jgi:serine/threonine protein kinase
MADRVGQQLGNYRLLRELGHGAFATVYLGEHHYLERPAAIKVLDVRIEPANHESFRREARTIAQLDHPHIISVYDFGIEDQTPYLVMEYMPNGTLRSRHPKGTRLSFDLIVAYVKQIASALDCAHQQRVIHRDIKPENILLNSKHKVVLSDFGLAVVQSTLDSLSIQDSGGTPQYMAPEQIQRRPCAASDQYALGVMVYEWLCGEPPFQGPLYEVFSQHLYKPPPSLRARVKELPPAVEDTVMGALAKDPQQRFVSVADFAKTLSQAFFATQSLSLGESVAQESLDQSALPSTGVSFGSVLLPSELEHEPLDQSALPATDVSFGSVLSPSEQESVDNATQPLFKTGPHIEREQEPVRGVSSQPTTQQQTILDQTRHSATQANRGVSVQEQNRKRMLQRLRRTYEELFAQSLHGVTQMEPKLADKPGAVQNAATLLFQTSTRPEQILPLGTSILHVYDKATQELLILGAPGAGKSTLLVELAWQLVARADADETHPLPVIVPLSSWAVKRLPLQIWLAEQVALLYDIPLALAQRWISSDQLLPLLDGLDEMEDDARPACVAEINAYHHDHLRLPVVVCSRQAEYEEATRRQRLTLQNAVVVQPLTHEHVQAYLAQGGEPSAALRHVLATNPALAEVATTPLMVHVLILTYQDTSVQQLSTQYEQLQQQIWTDYLARMVERKGNAIRYPLRQTRAWLEWLAQQMRTRNQTVFYLEHLQPDWLADRQRRAYEWLGVRLPAVIIGALVSILIGWLFRELEWSLLRIVILGGLLGGLLSPKMPDATPRAIIKTRRWHLRHWRWWATALSISIVVGLVLGWSYGWTTDAALNDWLFDSVILSLSSLLLQCMLALSPNRSSPMSSPDSGRWSVLRSFIQQLQPLRALLIALLIGLSFGLTIDISVGLSFGLILGLVSMLISVILGRLQEAVHLTERVTWKWRNLGKRLFASALMLIGCIVLSVVLFIVLFVVLGIGLSYLLGYGQNLGLINVLTFGLNYGLSLGLSFGLLFWLPLSMYQSIEQERIKDQDRRVSNQGVRLSLRYSLLFGLISGTMIGGIGIVTFGLSKAWDYWLSLWLTSGLHETLRAGMQYWLSDELSYVLSLGPSYFWSLFVASCILVWIIMGGLAVWRHYLIRFLLQRAHTFPLNASQFLNDTTSCILLQRLGGGYRFTHRLLLDSLADAMRSRTEQPQTSLMAQD